MVYEYHYHEKDWSDLRKHLFSDAFKDPDFLDDLREDFAESPSEVSELVGNILLRSKVIAGMLTFRANAYHLGQKILVPDEVKSEVGMWPQYSVVVGGDYVLDILGSDRIIKTSEYIENLEIMNQGRVLLDPEMSVWYDKEGNQIVPTLDMMKNYCGLV